MPPQRGVQAVSRTSVSGADTRPVSIRRPGSDIAGARDADLMPVPPPWSPPRQCSGVCCQMASLKRIKLRSNSAPQSAQSR